MGLHPIFQEITENVFPGLRPVADPVSGILANIDQAVINRAGGQGLVALRAEAEGWSAPSPTSERGRMLAKALEAVGTPWSFKGEQADTHDNWSLVKACATYATGRDLIDVDRLSADWAIGVSDERARMAFAQWGLTQVRDNHAEPGDLMLFRMGQLGVHPMIMSMPGGDFPRAHAGPRAMMSEAKAVHAGWAKSCTECWLGEFWTSKLIGVWSFDRRGPRPGAREDADALGYGLNTFPRAA